MKIAIPCKEDAIETSVDDRFGRARCFYIYDIASRSGYFIDNPHKDDNQGVGTKVVELLAQEGIGSVYANEVGGKAQPLLNTLHIEIHIVEKDTPVKQITDMLNQKK